MSKVLLIVKHEFLFFRKRWLQVTSAALVSPILYAIAFGWGLGRHVEMHGRPYMDFVLPGIIALTGMFASYSAVAMRVNTARVHEHSFEYYLVAPIHLVELAVGYTLAGMLRGLYAVALVTGVFFAAGQRIPVDASFLLICLLNTAAFASLGYAAAVMIDNHYDMANFSAYVMTPMVFLCGTFFSLEALPPTVRTLVWALPLSQASSGLRAVAYGTAVSVWVYVILSLSVLLCMALSVAMSRKDMP
jgi:ABC-type polysaccharide/polyol phosphate export permease